MTFYNREKDFKILDEMRILHKICAFAQEGYKLG